MAISFPNIIIISLIGSVVQESTSISRSLGYIWSGSRNIAEMLIMLSSCALVRSSICRCSGIAHGVRYSAERCATVVCRVGCRPRKGTCIFYVMHHKCNFWWKVLFVINPFAALWKFTLCLTTHYTSFWWPFSRWTWWQCRWIEASEEDLVGLHQGGCGRFDLFWGDAEVRN